MKNLGFLGFPNYAACDINQAIYSLHSNRFLSKGLSHNGYVTVHLSESNNQYTKKLHRLLMLAFKYKDGCEDLEVNHIDGNKLNNSLSNLEWCTKEYNQKHAVDLGLKKSLDTSIVKEVCERLQDGEQGKTIAESLNLTKQQVSAIKQRVNFKEISKDYKWANYGLSDTQVHEICKLILDGMRNIDIARLYETSTSSISAIRSGKTFKHVTCEYPLKDSPSINKRISPEMIVKVCKLLEKGESTNYIATALNISKSKVYKIRNRQLGLKISCNFNF